MTDIAIKTDKLTRDFNGVRAVDSLSLQVPRGTIFGFLGPNGAGKTTTIRLLLGLIEPSAGRASLLGFDTVQEPSMIRSMSGALLENHGLYEKLSARDNLELYGRIFRLPTSERQERIK
jgi:ABC-2 type transport system ATP-binding protein